MNRLNIICEPLSSGASVQFELMKLVIKILNGENEITLISPYIPENKKEKLGELKGLKVVSLSQKKRLLRLIYSKVGKNEAILWGISWIMESLFKVNSSLLLDRENEIGTQPNLNLAYTLPSKSLLYWNQATPPLKTLKMMESNFLAKPMIRIFGPVIELLDRNMRRRHRKLSENIAHNSSYLAEQYMETELHSDTVVHTPKEFAPYSYEEKPKRGDYVLAYIGKEVQIDVLLKLANQGIRILSFGSKIPYGTPISKLKENLGFMGFVDDTTLEDLYRKALFTVFPFTEEPFGWVPLESMYHGTPVLSYNKQGPSETIINGVTGWLVEDRDELINKANELWNSEELGIFQKKCVDRALSYSLENTREHLLAVLNSAYSGSRSDIDTS